MARRYDSIWDNDNDWAENTFGTQDSSSSDDSSGSSDSPSWWDSVGSTFNNIMQDVGNFVTGQSNMQRENAEQESSFFTPDSDDSNSIWNQIKAGDVSGLIDRVEDSADEAFDGIKQAYSQDLGPAVDDFWTGAKQGFAEWVRAKQQEADVLSNPDSTQQEIDEATEYSARAGMQLIKGPLSLIPSIGTANLLSSIIMHPVDTAKEVGQDFENLDSDQMIERPFFTLGKVLMDVGVAYGGYKGGKGIWDKVHGTDDMAKAEDPAAKDNPDGTEKVEGIQDDDTEQLTTSNSDDTSSTDDTSTPSAPSGNYSADAEGAYQQLVNEGFTDGQARGILGNIMQEDGSFDPTNTNATGHVGLFQLDTDDGNRWGRFVDYCNQNGLDPANNANQIHYVTKIENGDLTQQLPDDASAAATWFNVNIERSGDNSGARESNAENFNSSYTPSNTSAPSGDGAGGGDWDASQQSWLGQTMDNHGEGCVEAVTKLGGDSPFLKAERDKGVTYVPTLVEDAGDRVIPFDESKLQPGDVIVYGDNDHVTRYDGRGGYYGNSSSRDQIVHSENLYDCGNPTAIIKTGHGQSTGRPGASQDDSHAFDASTQQAAKDDKAIEESLHDDDSSSGADGTESNADAAGGEPTPEAPIIRRRRRSYADTEEPLLPDDVQQDPMTPTPRSQEEIVQDVINDRMGLQPRRRNRYDASNFGPEASFGGEENVDAAEAPAGDNLAATVQGVINDRMNLNTEDEAPEAPILRRSSTPNVITETPSGSAQPAPTAGKRHSRYDASNFGPEASFGGEEAPVDVPAVPNISIEGPHDRVWVNQEAVDRLNQQSSPSTLVDDIAREEAEATPQQTDRYGIRRNADGSVARPETTGNPKTPTPPDPDRYKHGIFDAQTYVPIQADEYHGSPVKRSDVLYQANHAIPKYGDEYKTDATGAHTAAYENFDKLGDEIGQTLDRKYALTDGLNDIQEAELKQGYRDVHRGVAHFVHEYISNPDMAKREYPHYYTKFEDTMKKQAPDVLGKIHGIGYKVRQWAAQPDEAKVDSTIKMIGPQGLKGKVKSLPHKIYNELETKLVDKFNEAQQTEKAASKIGGQDIDTNNSAYIDMRQHADKTSGIVETLVKGKGDANDVAAINSAVGAHVTDGYVPLQGIAKKLNDLDKSNSEWLKGSGYKSHKDALSNYLVAQHELEMSGAHKHYVSPLNKSEYEAVVNTAPKEIKSVADDFYNLQDAVMKISMKNGLISRRQYYSIQKDTPHKLMLLNNIAEDDAFVKALGASTNKNPLKGPVEDVREDPMEVKNPIDNVVRNIQRAVNLGNKNQIINNYIENVGNKVGGLIWKHEGGPATDNDITVYQNGRAIKYQTTPEMKACFDLLKPEEMQGMLSKIAAMPARLVRATAVTFNPLFQGRNIIRDQQSAYLNSDYGYKPLIDFQLRQGGKFSSDKVKKYWAEYKTNGVAGSTEINAVKNRVSDIIDEFNRNPLQKVGHAANPLTYMEGLNNYIENGTRFGAYIKAREKGASVKEAVNEAKNITLDFSKSGTLVKKLNRYVPFLNASIQDTALLGAKMKDHPVRTLARAAAIFTAMSATEQALVNKDGSRDEYEKFDERTKNNYWLFHTGKIPFAAPNGWLAIPKAFLPGILFGSGPADAYRSGLKRNKDKDVMYEWLKSFADQIVPDAFPTAAKVPYELATNKSLFYSGGITGMAMDKLTGHKSPKGEIVKTDPYADKKSAQDKYEQKLLDEKKTSGLAQFIAEKMGVKPEQIEYGLKSVLTNTYTQGTALADYASGKSTGTEAYNKAFSPTDPYKNPSNIQDFYDVKEDLGNKWKSVKSGEGHMSQTEMRDYNNVIAPASKVMKNYNEQINLAKLKNDDKEVRRVKKAQSQYIDWVMSSLRSRK
jgi:hypothetical protein